MGNPLGKFGNASSEMKLFIITLIILFVIVLGTFFYAYMRIPANRSTATTTLQEKVVEDSSTNSLS